VRQNNRRENRINVLQVLDTMDRELTEAIYAEHERGLDEEMALEMGLYESDRYADCNCELCRPLSAEDQEYVDSYFE